MDSIQKKDLWQAHIEECAKSGLSQVEYCTTQKIPVSTFGYWKRKLKGGSNCKPVFYPLSLSPCHSSSHEEKESGLTLHVKNKRFSIKIEKGFSASTLSQLVSTLERL